MDDGEFEGTLVLEKLAAVGRLDDFADAVDADDTGTAEFLMEMAGVDAGTIETVLRKMRLADGEH